MQYKGNLRREFSWRPLWKLVILLWPVKLFSCPVGHISSLGTYWWATTFCVRVKFYAESKNDTQKSRRGLNSAILRYFPAKSLVLNTFRKIVRTQTRVGASIVICAGYWWNFMESSRIDSKMSISSLVGLWVELVANSCHGVHSQRFRDDKYLLPYRNEISCYVK